jgi:hypothetical protein
MHGPRPDRFDIAIVLAGVVLIWTLVMVCF